MGLFGHNFEFVEKYVELVRREVKIETILESYIKSR